MTPTTKLPPSDTASTLRNEPVLTENPTGTGGEEALLPPTRTRTLRHFGIGALIVVSLAVSGMLFQRWRAVQPVPVSVTTPVVRSVTETIAVTGRVAGYRETLVGSQNAGILRELRVQAGDRIRKGGLLAKMESAVALTHLALAQKTLTTVRARRTEIARGPRTSEVDAARARVAQAVASSAEALAAVDEALPTLPQAQAAVAQMQARRDLASRDQTRQIALYRDGATAAVEVEKATVAFEAAAADLTVARQKVLVARASIGAARSRAAAAAALARAVRADRRTLEAGPKPETVAVADRQVREAVEAIRVARAQVRTSDVLAPFAGTITAILAQVGTSVGPGGGIVKLVQTGNPEIRMDVDESNLPQLRVGERVVVTSAAYRNDAFEATVSRIGAQVDDARGTVEVVAAAPQAPLWIRPGQTLNVNIVTGEAVRRLFIPTVALRSDGDRHYVIDAAGGRARWQMVLPGEVAGNQVTVLEGLRGGEQIVTDPKIPFTAGAALKIRRESASGSGNRKSETR